MGSRSRYFQIGTHAFGPLTFGTRRETLGLEGQEAAIQRIGILFWNVAKQNVEDRIARIATKFGAQIIVLAESEMMPHRLTHALRNGSGETFKYLNTQCKRLAIATSINPRFIEFRFEADRYSIFELKLPLTKSYLVAAAHGPSKLYWKQEDQAHFVRSLSASVRDVEKGVGHSRTIVIGDFNLDPFENPMVEVPYSEILARDLALLGGDDLMLTICCLNAFQNGVTPAAMKRVLNENSGQIDVQLRQFERWQKYERRVRKRADIVNKLDDLRTVI